MIKFPFTTLQQCNLDWIMQQLHKILDFMPLNGSPGDVLQRNVDGAAWMPIAAVSMDIHGLNTIADVSPADELPIYDNSIQGNFKVTVSDLLDSLTIPVESVNGMTGDVILDAYDVGALPDTYTPPVTSVNGMTGDVTVSGGAVDSVNGQTGVVVLGAADVGALPNTTVIPDSTSDLVNDSGFVDAAGAAAAAPVQSVNGQTGAVIISAGSNSLIFNSDSALNVSAYPSDVTVYSSNLWAGLSSDGKAIHLYGNITTSFPDLNGTTGWKDFVLQGLTVPAQTSIKAIYNCGMTYYSGTGANQPHYHFSDQYGNTRVRILTDGSIVIGIYYPSIGSSDIVYTTFYPIPLGLD